MSLLQTHNCMKKIWIKRFTSLALSLTLLTNSLTPYVLAQEITPSPDPTPTAETTPTPEPTLTVTPTPETSPTPTLEVTPEVTPEATPTPTPDTNTIDPNLSTTPSDPLPTPTPSIDLDSPDAQGSAQLTPSLSTDKDDYGPTEIVIISGSDYQPNTTYTLVISSQDEPAVRYETTITTTEDGSIYYAYQLDGIYRPDYLVEIFLGSSLVKSITFTDSVSEYPKTICHHTPGNEVTLTFHNAQSYNGHLGTPHNDQTYDTDGPCEDSQPTEEIIVVYHSDLATNISDVVANPQSWFFYNDEEEFEGIDNSLGSFVNGPDTAPRGDGSVEISVSGSQRRNLATYQFSGTPLASITTLAYSTYNPSAGNGGSANRVGYLGFNVDFDGSDTWQKRLLFHPTANGTVQQDTWQEWDAINNGDALWTWSGLTGHGGSGTQWPDGNTSEYRSINELVTAFPNIRVRVSDPWMGIRVGAPYPDGYTENIDLFKFGTANHTTIWDFEPDQSQPEPVCGNGLVEDGEQCDYNSLNGSSSCSSSCQWVAECRQENIANGDFDIPSVTHSQKWDIFENEEVPGWTAEWYGGSSSYSSQDRPSPKIEIHAGVNNWAPVDNPYVELDSDWAGPDGSLNNEPASITLSQQIPTIPGYQYTLSWKHSPRPNHNNNYLLVEVNGTEVFDSGVLSGSSGINWVSKTHTFTADSDLTTISFTELGTPDSFGMFLDDVSLECNGQEITQYQCNQTIYAANNLTGFYDVNPTNGVLTNITTLTKGSSASADDPFNDRTYYIDRYGDNLYYLQHSDLGDHLVGSTGIGISSPVTKLAFNVYGELYGLTDKHQLYSIDTSTGIATPLGTVPGIGTGGDIVFDETNTLYLISTDGKLYSVTLPGLVPTLVKNTGISPITGLAYLGNQFYFSSTHAVYRIDKDGNNQIQLSSQQPQINDLSSCQPGQEPTGRLQGTKYYDSNGNGIHDINDGETNYLNDWTIRLYDENWKYVDETVTSDLGNKGQYRFDVAPGTYNVCEVLKDDWTQTGPVLGAQSIDNNHNPTGNGIAVANGSNAEDEAGVCWQAELESDELDGWLKFGNARYSDVTVCKVNEANDPLSGWTVGILGSKIDTYTVPVNNTSVSTANLLAGDYALLAHGTYRFANWGDAGIADAGYSLRIPGQSYSAHTNPYDTWVSGDELNTPGALEIQVNGNNVDWEPFSAVHEYLFSLNSHPGGSLSFRIYDNVISDNINSVTDPLSVSVHQGYVGTTSENGCTTLEDVPYGDYTLYESLQAGWESIEGHNASVSVESPSQQFTIKNQATGVTRSISGFKYEDTGFGTNVLAGWGVQLFGCTSLDESTCNSEAGNTITDENGKYSFDVLDAGYYLVKEEDRSGWSAHLFSSWFVDLFSQQSAQVDFTNARNSSITVCKVEDSDGNLETVGDRNIVGGWPISLYQNSEPVDTQNTEEDGCYTWENLDPYQSYKVSENVENSGYIDLDGTEHTFEFLTPNQDHQHTFINFQAGWVRGYKYHDINADGIWVTPEGESPLNDWEICLVPYQQTEEQEIDRFSVSEALLEEPNCVLTGAGEWPDGYYEFTNLGPGSYRLYETPRSSWEQTEPADINGYVFTVTSGFGAGGVAQYNFGNYSPSYLFLTKSVTRSGDIATYTLTVRNEGIGQVDDVSITDTLPTDFVLDTDSVTLTHPNGSITNPSTTNLGSNKYEWYIADVIYHYDSEATPLEVYTLTYEASINGEAGIHTNVAVADGDDPGQSPVFSNYATALLAIASDLDYSAGVSGDEQEGDVLGASTSTGQVLGAATGTPSLWTLLGLLFVALGLVLRLPTDKLKKLITTFSLVLIPLFVTSPVLAEEPKPDLTPPSVHIVDLPTYKNINSFEISYTALDAGTSGLKDITLEFHREGQSWQNLTTLTSSSGKFMVNSSHITQDDKYYFRSTACDNAGNCASDETSTIVDRELPPAPESFQKSWKDEYTYILKWHNPSSTQNYKVYIYRYHEPVFIAQEGSRIAILDVTPNTDIEWQNSHPEAKPYYYAIRNVDPAGNTSGLVSDPETTVTTSSTDTSAPQGTPVTGSESFSGTKLVAAQSGSGQILGEKDTQDQDQDPEVSPDSDAINQALDQAASEGDQDSPSSIPWRILIITGVGLILIYIFYIRKK